MKEIKATKASGRAMHKTELFFLPFAFLSTWFAGGAGLAQDRVPCAYQQNVEQSCGEYACIVAGQSGVPKKGTKGFCGLCRLKPMPESDEDLLGDYDCGGRGCKADGTCDSGAVVIPAKPLWPHFHLLVSDLSAVEGSGGGYDFKASLGVGYLFQGALGKTEPRALDDGGFVTPRLPRFYFSLGFLAALTPQSQVFTADLGLTVHAPLIPFLPTYTIAGVYQRQGASIWNIVDNEENFDRIGPALTVGFLYNIFLRFGYLWHLRGESTDEGSFLISVIYMQDLVNDLVPDRFKHFVP